MDDNTRENVVAAGTILADWTIFKNANNFQRAAMYGTVDGIHTGYIVGRNTGDERLGRRAGTRAGLRTFGWFLAAFTLPPVLFLGVVIGTMATGMNADAQSNVGIPLVLACFVLFFILAVKAARAMQQNRYARFNLPSEDEMNRSGYYEVEPDTWFNPVTNQVQMGHAYVRSEMGWGSNAWGVRTNRTEDQAIRALYKQRKTFQAPQSPPQATHHVPKRYSTGSR